MPQDIDSSLKAMNVLGIEARVLSGFGVDIDYEDLGLDSESASESLEMRSTKVVGTEGEFSAELFEATSQNAFGLDGGNTSAFSQYTKALKAVGVALEAFLVAPVSPPSLVFTHWGQTDILFEDGAMNVNYGELG